MSRTRRICFVVTGTHRGGAEVQVASLAREFGRRDWRVKVVSLLPIGVVGKELLSENIEVESLEMERGVPNPLALLKLKHIIEEFDPLVVHSHMVHANLLARVCRLSVQVPALLCTAHNIIEGGRLIDWAYRATERLCDLTTNVSRAGVTRFLEKGAATRGRMVMMPNGVDVQRFRSNPERRRTTRAALGLDDSEFVWLCVGRFEPVKDHDNLIRAFASLDSNARLLLAGRGVLERQTRQLVETLGISSRVRFLGLRSDIPDLLNAADAFVLASQWEGAPISILEAAAASRPVLATAVGGNRELVVEGKTGWLVPPRNDVALGWRMTKAMSAAPEVRAEMGRVARERAEKEFSIDAVTTGWIHLYDSILSTGRSQIAPEPQMVSSW
jgi:glycosyltransferase involved in cell wall biosynthesis